ncbi:exodeoxyribonuclease VII small subunit [Vallitalea sp.]|uniref:exodeoxyribonuclease VII small subunit n=1 Tax=Vallitalea sp. TaxID=1882829 RepID=UPI0025DC8D65|nr:exodeoxyribonuclease VII small subunit [Vallitalea sp.]MCT4687066.1 exodeoxyribonuclease VII small subunit [Vallitalea sp.]
MSNKLTFQENLDSLEKIVKRLESGETTLEESLELYKQGMMFLKECNNKIDKVEKEIEVIQNEN